jgi:hypothetical protein
VDRVAAQTEPHNPPRAIPPALGDLSSRELIANHQGLPTVRRLDLGQRGATPGDVRRELRRRSAVGRD